MLSVTSANKQDNTPDIVTAVSQWKKHNVTLVESIRALKVSN